MLIVLSPWKDDWKEDVEGSPKNFFLAKELSNLGVETYWFYLGEGKITREGSISFIPLGLKLPSYLPNTLAFLRISESVVSKVIQNLNGKVDLILSFYGMAIPGCKLARKLGAKHVAKFFGIFTNPLVYNVNSLWNMLTNPMLYVARKCNVEGFVVEEDGSNVEFFFKLLGVPKSKLYINKQPIYPFARKPKEGRFVGFSGNLVDYKGVGLLLKAVRIFKEAKFLVAGWGKLVRKLSAYSNVRLVSYTFFQMHSFYSDIRFLINPSKYANMTRPTVEALYFGKPVIAYDVSLNSIIEHGFNGFLAKPYDEKEFLKYVEMLLHDDELLRRLSFNAYVSVRNQPTIQENTSKEVAFYMKFLNAG